MGQAEAEPRISVSHLEGSRHLQHLSMLPGLELGYTEMDAGSGQPLSLPQALWGQWALSQSGVSVSISRESPGLSGYPGRGCICPIAAPDCPSLRDPPQ